MYDQTILIVKSAIIHFQ